MDKGKPVAYPNLVDALNEVVDTHAAMHDAIAEHADDHIAAVAAKRQKLSIARNAQDLMRGEVKP